VSQPIESTELRPHETRGPHSDIRRIEPRLRGVASVFGNAKMPTALLTGRRTTAISWKPAASSGASSTAARRPPRASARASAANAPPFRCPLPRSRLERRSRGIPLQATPCAQFAACYIPDQSLRPNQDCNNRPIRYAHPQPAS
jgi:hypothetical protein